MPARLALIADVHANLAALDAVLAAIDARGFSDGACAGDLVMRGADPEQCVQLVRRRGWPCVRGNTDAKVTGDPPRPPEHPASARVGSRSWSIRRLTPESLHYLAELPLFARLTLEGHRVVVLHGDATNGFPAISDDTPLGDLRRLAKELDADCIVSGHTHRPSVRRAGDVLVVNPGSVGEGSADDRRPSWAWLQATDQGLTAHLERVEAQVARVRDRENDPT